MSILVSELVVATKADTAKAVCGVLVKLIQANVSASKFMDRRGEAMRYFQVRAFIGIAAGLNLGARADVA
jgi:hypothetical protein